MISLSVSDLVSPVFTYWMNIVASFHGEWPFGEFGCALYGLTQGHCALVSITIVAVVAGERCMARQ